MSRTGVNHTAVSRLALKHGLTGQVKDRPRLGRPRAHDDRTLVFICTRHHMAGSRFSPTLERWCEVIDVKHSREA